MTDNKKAPRNDEAKEIHNENSSISPAMPRPSTRLALVLAALRNGQTLTQAETLRRGWGWRLAADVFALREKGWQIVSEEIPQAKGNPVARYWLPADKRGPK